MFGAVAVEEVTGAGYKTSGDAWKSQEIDVTVRWASVEMETGNNFHRDALQQGNATAAVC